MKPTTCNISRFSPSDIHEFVVKDGLIILKGIGEFNGGLDQYFRSTNDFKVLSSPSNISPDPTRAADNSGLGYTNLGLNLHTDRSGLPTPPRFIAGCLSIKSKSGGTSTFSDGLKTFEELKNKNPSLISVFSVEGSVVIRRKSNFLPTQLFSIDDNRPSTIRFRNDNDIYIRPDDLPRFRELIDFFDKNMFSINLDEGDGYIIDNHRYLHGRTSFEGTRQFQRLLMD